ncbi:MAG TPA: peptidoglycan-binding protein, partial [Gammaproteobacteria bacterium]|nr:peptidoglycan-binding protein [Gammaproteobacteria bacterium]
LAAVLELMAEGGQRRQAIVTAIDDDHLSMIVGDETYTVSVADLDTYWTGNFLLFWRTSPSGSMVIKPGERSDDVLWLKQQLDHTEVSGGAEKNHSRHYDEKLRRRVMKFQLDNGLYPDGIAGEKTLIKLTAAQLDGSTPILAEVK